MARLIDADELLKRYGLDKATKYGNKNKAQQENSYSTMYMYEIADMIDDAPTIDAVEQKHGHWIYKKLDNYKKYSVTCSVCGAEYIDNYDGYITAENFNGCPNCLAKMDEVTE